jgi:hypothetical protein
MAPVSLCMALGSQSDGEWLCTVLHAYADKSTYILFIACCPLSNIIMAKWILVFGRKASVGGAIHRCFLRHATELHVPVMQARKPVERHCSIEMPPCGTVAEQVIENERALSYNTHKKDTPAHPHTQNITAVYRQHSADNSARTVNYLQPLGMKEATFAFRAVLYLLCQLSSSLLSSSSSSSSKSRSGHVRKEQLVQDLQLLTQI